MTEIIVGSALVSYQEKWDMGFHEHVDLEISVVLEGRGLFEALGQTYSIEAGHVVMIPANLPHRYWTSYPIRFAVLSIINMPAESQQLFFRLASKFRPQLLFFSEIDLKQYETMFRQWLRSISQPLVEQERYSRTWIELFLLFILQHASLDNKFVALSISSAADYIRSNLHIPDLLISDLAKIAGLSESGFRDTFKKIYKVSPKRYQHKFRMAEAKWLLRSTDRSIQTISEHVGFSSLHSFSAWFQKWEGAAPTEWRKVQQGKI